ncbi:MAG: PQQ-binding-like beta-propeller repeat protein, partial [bacterium]|nr:PQQ-binding-like beta-propeller repeat protein [bacterium]
MNRYNLNIYILIIPILLFACSDKKETEKKNRNTKPMNWSIFRGDAGLSGTTQDKVPGKLTLLWTFKTGSEIISSPVIGFDRVYIGSTDGKVYAINIKDGAKAWEYDSADDIEASPLLLDTSVYIGNLSGDIFALDAHT